MWGGNHLTRRDPPRGRRITAAFVEEAFRDSQHDDANLVEHLDGQTKWIQRLVALFSAHDPGGTGFLDVHSFETVLQDWHAQALFRELGLDLDFRRYRSLFRLFDSEHCGRISIDEFVQGCYHLKGPARSLDMYLAMMKLTRKVDRVLRSAPDRQQTGGADAGFEAGRISEAIAEHPEAEASGEYCFEAGDEH